MWPFRSELEASFLYVLIILLTAVSSVVSNGTINNLPANIRLWNDLRQGGYVLAGVCLNFCLSVCLFANSRKTTDRIYMNILQEMCL